MSTTHSPAPWHVDFEKHYCGEGTPERRQARAIKAGRKIICAVLCKWRMHDPQSDADARLIAAAPDLLAQLSRLVATAEKMPVFSEWDFKEARAAIAKATK